MLILPFTVSMSRLLRIFFAALLWTSMPAYAAGPDLSAVKVCAVNGAQSVLCTITITNIGNNASVSPMSLTDNVTGSTNVNLTGGGGTLPASCTPGPQLINNVPINCSISTSLAPGASGTVLFSFTMPTGGQFTNCASVTQAQNPMTPADPDASNNTNICTTINVAAPAPTTGSITIIKDAQPNDGQDFTFTSNQASIAPFPLDDDSNSALADRKTFTGLPAGTYSFTETQVTGWTLASISCTPASGTSTNLSGGSATITLTAGGNVVCTFVNVYTPPPTGSITIIKDAQPNDGQDFTFTSNQASIAPFPLDDDSNSALADRKTFTGLPAGTYSFTETQVTGWTLASISCTPASGTSTNLSGGSATITLAAGGNVVCTFVNTKPTTGSLTIVKNSQPDNVQAFTFTASGAGLSNFTLDDDGTNANPLSNSVTFTNLAAGIPFTVTEDAVSGWTVPSLQCIVAVPGLTTTFTDQLNRTFTVNLEAGANVTCTFNNVFTPPATGSITIIKDAQPNDGQNFTFTSNQASIAPFPLDDDSDSTLADRKTFTGLPAGSYTFTETQVTGWALASISCTSTSNTTTSTNIVTAVASITLTAGGNVVCTFVNTKPATGTLTIVKDAQPNNVQAFNFTASGAGLSNFTLDDDGSTTNTFSNTVTFTNLAAGIPFTVTEGAVSGWTVPSLQCIVAVPGLTTTFTDQLNRTFTVNLQAGANVTCTFINVYTPPPTAKVCGVKFNDLNGNGLQEAGELGLANWQIGVGIAAIPPVTTGDKGQYCISDLPVGTYTVSEIQQAPWLQTYPAAPGTHTVTLVAGQQLNGVNFGNTLPTGPCYDSSGNPFALLGNGSFETAPLVSPGSYSFFDQTLVPSWDTSAADGQMEIWSNGFQGLPAYSGNHFLELNATMGATVYQNFTAIPGSTVTITFAHRGRVGYPNQMSVSLGAVGGLPTTLGTYTASTTAWTLSSITYTFPNNGQTAYMIGFVSGDSGPGGNFIDHIQMINTACRDVLVPDLTDLGKPKVFTFVEGTYPHLFQGVGVAGQSAQYSYRFYAQTGNYLAIDNMGTIFMLGSFTDNAVTTLGTIDSFRRLISKWYAGPISDSRVFDFAAGNYPDVFKGTPIAGEMEQYSYRFYPQSRNYIAVDNAGMLYILGPYTGNTLMRIGEVHSLRAAITAWEAVQR